ncbi:hypothetical protein [Paraburkholderia sp. CNPSo 3076]
MGCHSCAGACSRGAFDLS